MTWRTVAILPTDAAYTSVRIPCIGDAVCCRIYLQCLICIAAIIRLFVFTLFFLQSYEWGILLWNTKTTHSHTIGTLKNRVTAADLSILIFQFTNHATTHYIWFRVIIAYFSLEQNHGIGFVTRVTPVVYPLAVSHLHVCFQWVPLDLDLHHSIDTNCASLPSLCVWLHLVVHL